ncbi:MAG: NPCBM/NEW2 domain-containing protein [Pirellulales bacterium]|nr:NPCBM/NEW2 domain-containing protein [Pirellulales bacterium]
MWALVLITQLLAAAPPEAELQTLSGETLHGRLTELSRERMLFATQDGPKTLRPDDVLQLSFAPVHKPTNSVTRAGANKVWVTLADGSTLVGSEFASADGQASLTTTDGATIGMATSAIAVVRLRALTEAAAEQWTTILEGEHASDLLVVRKDDAIDFLEGVIRDVDAEKVHFELDGEILPVKRTKLDGFVYYHANRPDLPNAACRVTTTDGAQLAARAVHLGDDTWQVTTRGGLELTLPLGAIARLDYSQGKVVYLSDLDWDAKRSRWEPYFGQFAAESALEQFYAPRRDRGFESPQLVLGGTLFTKGLALRSRTELVYRLPDDFRRFSASLGIDDAVGNAGDAHVTIRGGDRVLFEGDVVGGAEPLPLDLDVQGVRELTILVDYGRDGDVADYVNFCDAKVIK